MKTFPLSGTTALALVLCATGCATSHQGDSISDAISVVNLAPATGPRGYVEFHTLKNRSKNGVSIYRAEAGQKPLLLGVIDVHAGGKYEVPAGNVPVGEIIRVAVAPGFSTFRIEREGKSLSVGVTEDMVTRVEVDRILIDRVVNYDVYRVETHVLAPVAFTEGTRPAVASHDRSRQ